MDLSTKKIVIPPGSSEQFVTFSDEMQANFPCGRIHMAAFCRYHAGYQVCYPGARRHNVVFCHAGEFRFDCNGVQGILHTGEMFVMPAGTRQAFWADGEAESVFFLIEPGERSVRAFSHVAVHDVELVFSLMKRMKRMKRAPVAEGRLVLTILAECMGDGDHSFSPPESILARLRHKLRSRLSHPWTIEEMAQFCHLSKPQFFVVWRREMHQTPHQFLTGLRMEQARELLEKTDYPVKGIASLCGFDQLFSFSRVFRHHFHTTPTEYRQRPLKD